MQPKHSLPDLVRVAHRVRAESTPGFRRSVWAKVEARRSPTSWLEWLRIHTLPVASGTVAALVVAGAVGAHLGTAARHEQREVSVDRYLASIDPHHASRTLP